MTMMRPILLLNILATATGTTKGQETTSIGRAVGKLRHAGLRGLSSGSWQKIPGHVEPFMADVAKDISEFAPKMDGEGQEDTTTTETIRWTNKKPTKKRGEVKDPLKKGQMKRGPKKVKGKRGRSSAVDGTPTSPVASTATILEEPTTSLPTASTESTSNEIFMWPAEVTTTPKAATTLCPPHYSTSAKYEIGDTIEAKARIYRCQSAPFYCNIAYMDDSWNDAEKDFWRDAWMLVGDCEQETLVEENEPLATEAPIATAEDATETTSTVATTTGAPVVTEAGTTEAPISSETTQLPPCPTDYNMAKTTYIAGEHTTVHSRIFKCSEKEGYDRYCNAAVWHDSLLEQNENAHEMWVHAWEEIGPCLPTQEEMMEAEAAAEDRLDG